MNCKSIQAELDIVYEKELKPNSLKELFKHEDINKISAPHLLKVHEEYCKSDVKVMFIGKETNKWWGKLNKFIDTPNAIEHLKKRYEKEFLNKKWKNKFFIKYREIRDNYFPSLLWANLLKMDSGANGSSKTAIGIKPIEDISIPILKRELEILKPNFIIFTTSTGQGYDRIIKEVIDDYKTDKSLYCKYNLWKFKSKKYQCTCYRTRHPNATKIKHAKDDKKYSVDDYYRMIIEDIQKEISL